MRWTIAALLVLLLPCGSSAQQMVKVNIVELYDKVPPPPADAKEAYARCEHGDEAKNLETKRMLVGAQGLMLAPMEGLEGMSVEATKEAALWYAKKLEVEKQKPQEVVAQPGEGG